jgi:hypothetical protein
MIKFMLGSSSEASKKIVSDPKKIGFVGNRPGRISAATVGEEPPHVDKLATSQATVESR